MLSSANDFCHEAKRSTVSAEDVLAAVEEIEMDQLIEPIQAYLKGKTAIWRTHFLICISTQH